MDTMRERFTAVTTELLAENSRVAVVLADIGVSAFRDSGAVRRHPDRVINVGIREQLMTGVAAGMALEGFRPIIHSYAPFVVERPFEQVKLDFAHQDLGAILVSVGASYDWPEGGRTHMSPGDVALMSTLPDWDIFIPGHPDEVETILREAAATDRRTYLRLSNQQNEIAIGAAVGGLELVRPASPGSPVVVAVGPTRDAVLAATAGHDVAVAYTARPFPLDIEGLRRLVAQDLVWVEPYLEGTSAHAIADALRDRPIRLRSVGVGRDELRKYGTPEDHIAAWGLDTVGLSATINQFLADPNQRTMARTAGR
jgi:transketolase